MAQVQITRAKVKGDEVRVVGLVDGAEYTVTVWRSHLQGLATRNQRVQYVAQQLKAVADAAADGNDFDVLATVTV